jgi:pimeloyl-ACP methyl ester carboxylesterase
MTPRTLRRRADADAATAHRSASARATVSRCVLATLCALGLLANGSLAGCAGQPTPLPQQQPGAPLAHTLSGQGAGPLLVLQSGLGDGSASWAEVLPLLARGHRVLAYDRPGEGGSAAVPGPRDPCTVADELHSLLQQLQLPPPYVLVGHSLGGLYQFVYARRYPGEVAGLVLLDPTHPAHWAQVQAQTPALAALLQGMRHTVFSDAAAREFDDQAQCLDTLPSAPTSAPADAPPAQVLLSTERTALETPAFVQMLEASRSDWLRLLGPRARLQRVPGAGHTIQRDAPAAVVEAVARVSKAAAAAPAVSPAGPASR